MARGLKVRMSKQYRFKKYTKVPNFPVVLHKYLLSLSGLPLKVNHICLKVVAIFRSLSNLLTHYIEVQTSPPHPSTATQEVRQRFRNVFIFKKLFYKYGANDRTILVGAVRVEGDSCGNTTSKRLQAREAHRKYPPKRTASNAKKTKSKIRFSLINITVVLLFLFLRWITKFCQ